MAGASAARPAVDAVRPAGVEALQPAATPAGVRKAVLDGLGRELLQGGVAATAPAEPRQPAEGGGPRRVVEAAATAGQVVGARRVVELADLGTAERARRRAPGRQVDPSPPSVLRAVVFPVSRKRRTFWSPAVCPAPPPPPVRVEFAAAPAEPWPEVPDPPRNSVVVP